MRQPEEKKALRAASIMGLRVRNSEGGEIGLIEDFVLDMETGRIAYAVMTSKGFLQGEERLFAVPFQSMILDLDRNEFILDADKNRLAEAPGFSGDKWPKMGDRRWGAKIHAWYGKKPYWESDSK